jgi:hypothetical protein
MLQLVYALTGTGPLPPLVDAQLEKYISNVKEKLENIIWEGNLRNYSEARELFELYGSLAYEARIRFFLSPEGVRVILAAHESGMRQDIFNILSMLRTLIERQGLGLTIEPGNFHLGDTIEVDIGSPACRRITPTSPVFFGAFEPFDAVEREIVQSKLTAAWEAIEHSTPNFVHLIRNYTRVIYIRKNGTLLPSSEQVNDEIGAIRLRNVHLDSYDVDQLSDDLIHESTHNFLSTFELCDFSFVKYGGKNSRNARPVSPWSMRPIRVLPFLHAAFVYFSMLNFVDVQLQDVNISDQKRQKYLARRNRYLSGFLFPGSLSDYVADFAEIDPRVLYLLNVLQQLVKERHTLSASVSDWQRKCA